MADVFVEVDQSGVYAMVETFEQGLDDAERFAGKQIENRIRNQVFYQVVHRLGAAAGEGFPYVYRDHLANFMRVNTDIRVQATGEGYLTVSYDLDGLGNYSDLEAGAHHQALLAINRNSLGTTRTGGLKYILHPPRVQLPYAGQELENEDSFKRQEFWEEVIIGRDFSYEVALRRGKHNWTIGDLLDGDIPTFEEVAAARVFEAWIPLGVAPEWLWLENGFTDSEPIIPPMDFSAVLANVTQCVAETIYEDALLGLVRLAEAAGGAVGVGRTGIPFQRSSGRFTPYKEEVGLADVDISDCLGAL